MYSRYRLSNGTRVVMEKVPHFNSVSIGVFINTGSINENKEINGISHFIEHMLFKGTKTRTGKEIAEYIDNIGGELNAFTDTEYTCFYVRTLDKHIDKAIDILADIINNPIFKDEDIKNEKKVIFEEIKMYIDSPEDLVYDMLYEVMFKENSLSLPIIGTVESVGKLKRETIIDYFNRYYIPENMVISVCGNFNSKEVLNMLEEHFYRKKDESVYRESLHNINDKPVVKQNITWKYKDIEQLNFCLGMEGIKRGDKDIYPLTIVNNILGGCVSSKLFQKIREEKGLVYSIYSNIDTYKTTGVFSIYAALSSEHLMQVIRLIKDELDSLKKYLITKEELNKSKEKIKSNYILGLEDTFSRMLNLGEAELLLGCPIPHQKILERIDKISLDDIERVILKVFDKNKYNISYVGKIKDYDRLNGQLIEVLFN